jgi:RHS repeat-associated protein
MNPHVATGLDHTPFRKYDSGRGRWTSPDPHGGSMEAGDPQSFNRYAYVNDDLSPHDLRRTVFTQALESGPGYRQVRMVSKHNGPKTVMRYDHGRENHEQYAVNFLGYDEEA